MTESPTLLSCREVTKRYGETTAVDAVTLDVHRGETVSVVGPSGCGKSTLLRAIAGLTAIDAGTIALDGAEVSGAKAFVPAERRGVGLVFQDLALFPHLTVAGNVAFGLRHGGAKGPRADRAETASRVQDVVALVGLADKAERYPHQLSGGEQQRVAIGRALAPDPALVLLDEPFSHLDRSLAVEVRTEAMAMLRRAGATVVLVTHDQDEALAVADRVAVLQHGRLAQFAEPAAVFHEPATAFVAALLGEADFVAGRRDGDVARTALGDLPIGLGEGADEGADVRVLLRPHHLGAVARGADAEGAGAEATVVRVEFRGGDVLHELRLGSGESVRALLPHTQALSPGDAASVTVRSQGRFCAYGDRRDLGPLP